MRKIGAASLFALAGAALLMSYFGFAALFDEYKDSPDSLFIVWGVSALVVAAVAAAIGALLLRDQ